MLMTIALFSTLVTGSYAQPNKPAVKSVSRQVYCMGQVMANEARPNLRGWVSVNVSLMVRGVSGDYGAYGDFCAAARAKNQFTSFKKKPTAAMLKVANQMYSDWSAKRKPSIETALQLQLDRCAYFHNSTVKPGWSKRFTKCGFVEGHHMYKAKGDPSLYSTTIASN